MLHEHPVPVRPIPSSEDRASAATRRPRCAPASSRRRPREDCRRRPRHPRRHPACEWLDRCLASGCEDSWRRLLDRYGPRLGRLVHMVANENGLRPSRAEVEELTQELFVSWLVRGRRGFDGRRASQFWRFVHSSVRNLVVDRVRRLTADKRSLECDPWLRPLSLHEVEQGHGGPGTSLATACGGTPESRMLRRETFDDGLRRFRAHCRDVVDDERDVEVLALAVLDGHTSRELSRALRRAGRPVGASTVDSWVCRLRRRLADDGLRLPRRSREPESAWPPKLPSVDSAS